MQLKSRNSTFRLYPSKKQVSVLGEWLGHHCDLYNCALDHRREAYEKYGVSISYLDQQNELPGIKKEHPYLVNLGSQSIQETLRRVDRAFKAFFRRVKQGQTPGYPRFKSKSRFDSFCYPGPAGWKIEYIHGKKGLLFIRNLGAVKMLGKPRIPIDRGERRTLTIWKQAGIWYATINVRYDHKYLTREIDEHRTAIGIDAGCTTLVYTSENKPIKNPKNLAKEQKRLKYIQKQLSRKKKGSNNRLKVKKRLQKVHHTITNKRKNFHHQISANLVKHHSFIAIEDLKLTNMTASAKGTIKEPGKNVKQKASLNRSLLDASIGILFQMIEYKAEEAGTRLEKVNPKGTSQMCAQCGSVVSKDLSIRTHQCNNCGFTTDRDHNAAINILSKGLQQSGLEQAEVWRASVSFPKKHETATIATA